MTYSINAKTKLFSLVVFTLLSNQLVVFAQIDTLFPSLRRGDSLFVNLNYEAAFDFYQHELVTEKVQTDTKLRAEIFHRLSQTDEKLNNFSEAISFHMKYLKLQPFKNQEENQQYLDKVMQLLPKASDSIGLTRLYYRFGLLLTHEANRDQAMQYYSRALEIAQGLKNYAAVATIANDIAGEYMDAGQKELSIQMYHKSLAAAKALNDSNRIAAAFINLAGISIDEGDLKMGIRIHLKALKIKEKLADKSNLSYYYQQTADVYLQALNYDKWEEDILKAYKLKDNKECTSALEKASLYSQLGGIAQHKMRYDDALQYYDTLLTLSKEMAYLNGEKTAVDNLALIYKDLGQYEKALQLTTQSEAFLTNNPYQHISHNNIKAELMLQLGKMHEALVLLNKNATNNALPNYASEKLRTFKLLYETNFGLKKYEDAFRWNDSLRILDNLLRDADVRKEMANLETKYQTEKKEQQITLLIAENEIKNQRIVLAMLFIGFLLLLGLLALALFYFRRKQAHFKQSELQQQLLRSQMNPHFIFNVMGSIQGYLYKNEATKAAEYLSRFAALSRSVLEISSQESITLKEEIEMLQNYIELQKTVMEKPFNVEYFIDEEMETDYIQIPPMLLQPFVENAIKHGLKNLNYQGKLSLCFKEKQDYIAVEIVDNGSGLEQNADSAHKSKALEIFQQRKKGIEHKFKKELIFEFQNLNTIDKTKHGVRVYLQLPILNND